MKHLRILLVLAVVALIPLSFDVESVQAAATAQGVTLNAGADCSSNADIDITLTSVGATREYGLVTTATTVQSEFEQATGIGDFSGTFVGYGMPITTAQAEGTLIGSYAYIGETPPSAGNTAEFFVAYLCSDTAGGNVVDYTCFGSYGTCPRTIAGLLYPSAPHLGLVQINAGAPVQTYGMPGGELQSFLLPADADGNGFDTYVVTEIDTIDGEYWLGLFIGSKDWLWVPYNSVIPLTPIVGID